MDRKKKNSVWKMRMGCKEETIVEYNKRKESVESHDHLHPEGTWYWLIEMACQCVKGYFMPTG